MSAFVFGKYEEIFFVYVGCADGEGEHGLIIRECGGIVSGLWVMVG